MRMRNGRRASGLFAPPALIFGQDLRLILGTQSPIPIQELDGGAWQRFFYIYSPASDSDEAAGVGHPLTISLPKGALQISRFNLLASGVAENR
jgi:hypothetical protein